MLIGIDASRAVTNRRTGTEAYAFFLIRALIPLATERRHHLRLYFNQAPSQHDFPDTGRVQTVTIPLSRLWTHLRLALELRRRPPDVFFTPAHVIPFTYRSPSVVTVHDLGYHHFPEAHPRNQLLYLRWSTRHSVSRSRKIIADSRATMNDLVRFDAVDPDRITVVYPGVNPELRPVNDRALLEAAWDKYRITPPYFLYIGTLQPRKNIARLLEAHAASDLPHQLVLAGKPGWLSEPILGRIASYQSSLPGRIALPGYVAEADKAALISGATALLYPSLYEGFGFPLLEAQACGTAVCCANTSSLPEIAGSGALMVDPMDVVALSDAMRSLASEPGLRQQLVDRGYENVKQFTWRRTAEQVLDVLEQALT